LGLELGDAVVADLVVDPDLAVVEADADQAAVN
jgi:hypothetical protein